MTSILQTGKYRPRKEWSTSSIPELSLDEETVSPSPVQIQVNGVPQKSSSRRSSLGIGLLTGGSSHKTNGSLTPDKHNKRRSSIAVAFLGRREKTNKDMNDIPAKKANQLSVYSVNNNNNEEELVYYVDSNVDPKRKRRSSWQAKMERRRRKSLAAQRIDENSITIIPVDQNDENVDQENIYRNSQGGVGLTVNGGGSMPGHYHRQKRHSWWNIFVPDNFKQRSRRSSQDVGLMTRSTDSIIPFRSKSRSVDHGLAPFDLDSLKSKVEGRIDSVERLREAERKKIPTISYYVGDRDTLTSVAARFDTTPSELTSLNRLISSFIYPGQQLLVPDKSKIGEGSETASNQSGKSSPVNGSRGKGSWDDLQEEKELLDGLRPTSPKPGHIERVTTTNPKEDDPIITQRFLKINVRHITDGQGVVGGVLLVTPNAVMFDPNVSDPLVIERGPESYGVIAPMELVVNAAIFHDIAHMRVGNEQSNEKPDVYYPKPPSPQPQNRFDGTHSPGNDSLLVKDETFPELGVSSVEGGDDQESICSSTEREGAAFPKAFDRDLVTPTNLSQDGTSAHSETKDNEDKSKEDDLVAEIRSLEERRKSLLDHHWAVPSKDSQNSHEEVEEEDETKLGEITHEIKVKTDEPKSDLEEAVINQLLPKLIHPAAGQELDSESLEKLSCHDSGIDIRDPAILKQLLPQLQQNAPPQQPPKKYSDADIVLSTEWVPPIPLASHLSANDGRSIISAQAHAQQLNADQGGRKKTSSVSFSVDEAEQPHHNNAINDKTAGDNKKNKMLKRLSYPLAWVEGLTGETNKSTDSTESAPNTGDSNQSVFSKVFSRRSSIGTFIRPHSSSDGSNSGSSTASGKPAKAAAPKLDYRSMVSIDDMPELFVSFDKLIPRPARACQDPPLYLRLRMGRPLGKATPLPSSVMSYGKNKLRPEYWFSIPKNRVDELFRFLNSWVPQLYGELDEEKIKEMGYELIEHDTEWAQSGILKLNRSSTDVEDIAEMTRESWEASKNVLSMSAGDYDKHILFPGDSIEVEFALPDLVGQTEILTEEHREKLCGHLPARAEGYSWSLIFSTSLHGFSLNSLYRKMYRLESPVLIVIQDTDNNVFGALTSCSLHVSDHFYGTGESLLYKFNPSFKVFHWTGENLYFIKGNPESLSIGAGDGKFGLWLDGDLNQGRTQPCSTYANEPLSPEEDFVIKTIECWAFV